jgi:hypothetical protein
MFAGSFIFHFLNQRNPRNLRTSKMSSATAHLSAESRASLTQHTAVIIGDSGRWAKQPKIVLTLML